MIKAPGFRQSMMMLSTIIAVIGIGMFYLHVDLHILLLCCLLIVSFNALQLGASYKEIRQAMDNGISQALGAIYIFILIGVLIAAFIQSGTLAFLLYYSIKFISPSIFLPSGLLFCSVMSITTGTSWGTVSTAGVVIMSIGESMGFPAPLVAGIVVSGACFGDKMSPVSDTTNLASMASRVNLYDHIKSMTYTTGPTYLLVLVIFSLLGLSYSSQPMPEERLRVLSEALNSAFNLNPVVLLPLLVMVMLSARKISAELAMLFSSLSAVIVALAVQKYDLTEIINSLFSGGTITTGVEQVDNLLVRGGILSMMNTLSLSLIVLAMGGVMGRFKFLEVLVTVILVKVKRTGALVATTIVTCLLGNITMGEAYLSIILGGQLFCKAFDKQFIDRSILSRSLEEGATLSASLIPWTTAGIFFTATLGVSALDYAPWALLNWINPLLSIVFAYLGIALFKQKGGSHRMPVESS